jgi:branched-chain amino acid transport system permease protein
MLLTSFSVTIFLENLAIILFRPTSRPFPSPTVLRSVIEMGQLRVAGLDLVAIAVVALLLLALTLFVRRTDIGIAMRASSQDLLAARVSGR